MMHPREVLRLRYQHVSTRLAAVSLHALGEGSPERPWAPDEDGPYLDVIPRDLVPDLLRAHGVLDLLDQHPERARARLLSQRTAPARDQIWLWIGDSATPDTTLLELTLDREHLRPDPPFPSPLRGVLLNTLNVEWLLVQDPWADFSPDRPRAPGQRHPSGRVAMKILALLYTLRRKLGADAMVTLGEFFHNAHIFSRAFRYIDPEMEGIYATACRDLMDGHGLDRTQTSWAFDWGLVTDHTGRVYRWPTELQVSYDTPPLDAYFASPDYKAIVHHTLARWRFHLDRPAFDARWPHTA